LLAFSRRCTSLQVTDLGAARSASSGWADAEARKVSEWGQGEIQRILAQTEAYEKQLVEGAKQKQAALDASHAAELQKAVQDMDLAKAKELKELEDGLQRQIQVGARGGSRRSRWVDACSVCVPRPSPLRIHSPQPVCSLCCCFVL